MGIDLNDPEVQLVLKGPIFPELLRDDTLIIDERGWYQTLSPSSRRAADNEVLFSNLGPHDIDKQIDAVLARYHDRDLPMRWCVYPWSQPSDLGVRLLGRGAKHWAVLAVVRETAGDIETTEDVEVDRVDPASPDSLERYLRLMAEGWHFDETETAFRRRRYRELLGGERPKMILFVARCDGIDAGAAALVFQGDAAYLGMGGDYVPPAFRSRAVFRKLVSVRLNLLREMGIKLTCGHARVKTAAPRLLTMGYRPKFTYQIYQLDPPSKAG